VVPIYDAKIPEEDEGIYEIADRIARKPAMLMMGSVGEKS
jgi:hypothetical protein